MDKISFSFVLSEEQQAAKEQLCKKLLKKKHVKQWIKKNHVDEAYIFAHSGKIYDWNNQREKCDGCQGLAFCRQPVKGCFYDLEIDQVLHKVLNKCNHQKAFEKAYKHKEKYRIMDMLESYLLVNIQALGRELASENSKSSTDILKGIDMLLAENPVKGMYLYGKPGVGKSYLAAGITNYFAKETTKSVAYVNVPKFISDVKLLFQDAEQLDRKLRMVKNVDVLVLDDIGGESITTWSRDEVLLPILDQRMEQKKLTIFTSNYKMAELKVKLAHTSNKMAEEMAAERIMDRIKALSDEVFVKGESRRK